MLAPREVHVRFRLFLLVSVFLLLCMSLLFPLGLGRRSSLLLDLDPTVGGIVLVPALTSRNNHVRFV